jgi:hypothetical protein
LIRLRLAHALTLCVLIHTGLALEHMDNLRDSLEEP